MHPSTLYKLAQQAKLDSRVAPYDWTYPGKRTFQESNIHPLKPDASRVKELKQVSQSLGLLVCSQE